MHVLKFLRGDGEKRVGAQIFYYYNGEFRLYSEMSFCYCATDTSLYEPLVISYRSRIGMTNVKEKQKCIRDKINFGKN